MQKNDKIPVLTDLIEKGIDIKLSELGPDANQDLVFDIEEREEPKVDINEPDLKSEKNPGMLKNDPDLEQAIRNILDEHMELAWQEIKQVIQKTEK